MPRDMELFLRIANRKIVIRVAARTPAAPGNRSCASVGCEKLERRRAENEGAAERGCLDLGAEGIRVMLARRCAAWGVVPIGAFIVGWWWWLGGRGWWLVVGGWWLVVGWWLVGGWLVLVGGGGRKWLR